MMVDNVAQGCYRCGTLRMVMPFHCYAVFSVSDATVIGVPFGYGICLCERRNGLTYTAPRLNTFSSISLKSPISRQINQMTIGEVSGKRTNAMTTKNRLLAYLKENKGSWVSGESLSSQMSVSRSALWKHVRSLKQEGYRIESSPKKGYLFRESPDLLFVEEIGQGLKTRWLGKGHIDYYTETDSTNIRARTLVMAGAAEGSIVIAETQTAGKGRRGRPWFSPREKGIYISVIVRPAIPPVETPKLVLLSSITIAELLRTRMCLKAEIKWPNDVLVNGKKVAGILLEVGTEMDAVDYCIVGLGLNVNIPQDSFPDDIKDSATSLLIESGKHVSRVHLVQDYLMLFEQYYERFIDGRGGDIVARWKKLADIVGRRITVDLSGRIYSGNVTDVDDNGALMITDTTGNTHRVFSGDVTYDS